MQKKSENYFSQFAWPDILHMYKELKFSISEYHKILCKNDYPEFLDKYLELPLLKRLSGVGLLCGSDWTKLFHNRFFYSRLDHSIGVALIIWHYTHDKKQAIAGLLHDVSTSVFSHVSDFRKGDALTQTVTENDNARLIREDKDLLDLLKNDGLVVEQVMDYHIYPVADNEIPQLSADRLEYMFPSGAVLEGSWNLLEIEKTYDDISVLQNEFGNPELGFNTLKIAEEYCRKFCITGHILQMHEDKICLNMLGQIMNMAVEEGLLCENDFMTLSESAVIEKIQDKGTSKFQKLYNTFRKMDKVIHTNERLDETEYYCLSLKVKQRYINPLVKTDKGTLRLSEVSDFAAKLIQDFLSWEDTPYGCVKLVTD